MILAAERVFDGTDLHHDTEVETEGGRIVALRPARGEVMSGTLAPGLIDLQVNGGGGVMVGPETLDTICEAHGRMGSTGILPTLITDTFDATRAVVEAGLDCTHSGFMGLHLEGPHLDPRRKGAHDAALIRPMEDRDLALLLRAARGLPALMVTLAPEAATAAQIGALAAAGAVVSLGHTDCTAPEAQAAIAAGASCTTHLFNAMAGVTARAPGLAGASFDIAAGIIADGIHVDPLLLRLAMTNPRLFLVTDCMAVAGTDLAEFTLGGRRILRRDGRLTLEDGTLAGADLTLPQAIARMGGDARALAMATSIPAGLMRSDRGRIAPGLPADLVLLEGGAAKRVWRAGVPL